MEHHIDSQNASSGLIDTAIVYMETVLGPHGDPVEKFITIQRIRK